MSGTDDYLIQAADPSQWAAGITYDPEGDGTPIGSLGTYEHWNNATDKKYSRNLGTGNGIELVALTKNDVTSVSDLYSQSNNVAAKIYPNPVKDNVFIEYNLANPCHVAAEIFNTKGQKMVELFNKNEIKGHFNFPWNAHNLKSGNYFLQIRVNIKGSESVSTTRFDVIN
jgi:flagellar hook assembly protein FlgD